MAVIGQSLSGGLLNIAPIAVANNSVYSLFGWCESVGKTLFVNGLLTES